MDQKWLKIIRGASLFIIAQQVIFIAYSFSEWLARSTWNQPLIIFASIFGFLYILFALGLFAFRERVRISFVRFQGFMVVAKIIYVFFSAYVVAYIIGPRKGAGFISSNAFLHELGIGFCLPPFSPILNFMYALFFTRPKVKKQFK
ncbi:MAG: hypothetical protein ABH845_06670 [Candidatus Omnitrophota bacterium]